MRAAAPVKSQLRVRVTTVKPRFAAPCPRCVGVRANIGTASSTTATNAISAKIIVTDIDAGRREFALTAGATRVIDPVTESVEGLDVDAFIDATGAARAVRSGIRAVRPAGRVILVGLGNDDLELPVSFLQNREIWLSGVFRYANTWPTAIRLAASGRVDLDAMVTGHYGLHDVEAALTASRDDPHSMKAIVRPGE